MNQQQMRRLMEERGLRVSSRRGGTVNQCFICIDGNGNKYFMKVYSHVKQNYPYVKRKALSEHLMYRINERNGNFLSLPPIVLFDQKIPALVTAFSALEPLNPAHLSSKPDKVIGVMERLLELIHALPATEMKKPITTGRRQYSRIKKDLNDLISSKTLMLSSDANKRVCRFLDEFADHNTDLVHGDALISNFHLSKGKIGLHDLERARIDDPAYDFATLYVDLYCNNIAGSHINLIHSKSFDAMVIRRIIENLSAYSIYRPRYGMVRGLSSRDIGKNIELLYNTCDKNALI